jgi:hypothetical protein
MQWTRRSFMATSGAALAAAQPGPDYQQQLDTLSQGFDGETCWVHPRAGIVPDGRGLAVVLTMQKLLLTGSDVFYALNDLRTDDLGQSWQGPRERQAQLGRREEAGGVVAALCDFTPQWHRKSSMLLGIGHVARYLNNRLMPAPRPVDSAFSIYNAAQRSWTPWRVVETPAAHRHLRFSAGCAQRVDLDDGEILQPVSFGDGKGPNRVAVARCSFDGETLRVRELGRPLAVNVKRGLVEPSLTKFGKRYFLTLRNDVKGYVAEGDGLRFSAPRPWCFDDGAELGNYNTQQHWVAHSAGLYLVYTRRGANNDHVFRHRAPLFVARVDPERLCVLRATERAVVPERGARLGNFGVTTVNRDETWITVSEWMQPRGCEKYGSDNSVYAARLRWRRPNELAER